MYGIPPPVYTRTQTYSFSEYFSGALSLVRLACRVFTALRRRLHRKSTTVGALDNVAEYGQHKVRFHETLDESHVNSYISIYLSGCRFTAAAARQRARVRRGGARRCAGTERWCTRTSSSARWRLGATPRVLRRCTAMQKLRIVILGFGTSRQKMVLK